MTTLSNFLNICLSQECKEEKMKKACAEKTGALYPLVLPMKEDTQACVEAGLKKLDEQPSTGETITDIIASILGTQNQPPPTNVTVPPSNNGIGKTMLIVGGVVVGIGALYLLFRTIKTK